MNAILTVALLCAEPSGDLQAGAIASRLRALNPAVNLVGVGARHCVAAGVSLWDDISFGSVVGVAESIPRFRTILDYYQRSRDSLLGIRPDLTVLIDAPAIHMRLAAKLKQNGLRSVYYFPPSSFSQNPKRARQVHSLVDAVVAPFGYTAQAYRKAGVPVRHFGHPLVDLFPPLPAAQARATLGLPDGRYVALLPGSRAQEIRLMTPVLVEAAVRLRRLHPDLHFLLPCATALAEASIRSRIPDPPDWLHIISGRSREVMAASRVAFVTSGSATLEAALLGVPMLLGYRVNPWDYVLGWCLVKTGLLKLPRFGLPNLVLQENVVLELLQHDCSPARICREMMRLLDDGPEREQHLADLARVRLALGEPGVVDHVARFVDAMARGMNADDAEKVARA